MAILSTERAAAVGGTSARPSRRWLLGAAALACLSSAGAWQAALHRPIAPPAPAPAAAGPAFTVYLVRTAEEAAFLRRAVGEGPTITVLVAGDPAALAAARREINDIRLGLAGQPVAIVDLTRP